MNLRNYTKLHSQAALAKLIDVAPSFVNQWVKSDRPIPIPTCVLIEQKTEGAVRRWDLRPDDWHLIWPELVGATDAPKVRKQKVAA